MHRISFVSYHPVPNEKYYGIIIVLLEIKTEGGNWFGQRIPYKISPYKDGNGFAPNEFIGKILDDFGKEIYVKGEFDSNFVTKDITAFIKKTMGEIFRRNPPQPCKDFQTANVFQHPTRSGAPAVYADQLQAAPASNNMPYPNGYGSTNPPPAANQIAYPRPPVSDPFEYPSPPQMELPLSPANDPHAGGEPAFPF